jgi:ferredoxin
VLWILILINKIYIKGHKGSYEYIAGKSILASLENSGLHIDNACRMGLCGTCKVRLIKGEIGYGEKKFAEIKEDEILICNSYPKTDIIIEIIK